VDPLIRRLENNVTIQVPEISYRIVGEQTLVMMATRCLSTISAAAAVYKGTLVTLTQNATPMEL
jgi:hypothetical protein